MITFNVLLQKEEKYHLVTLYKLSMPMEQNTGMKLDIDSRDAFIKPFEKWEKVFISNVHFWRIKIGRNLQSRI